MKNKIILFFVCLLCVFFCIDRGAFYLFDAIELPLAVIDIQTPTSFYCKLDYIKRLKGKKIVCLGDSVIYGGTMADYHYSEWKKYTLSKHLERLFSENGFSKKDVHVINLGMNGALPKDLECCFHLLKDMDIDLFIMDVTLRSFSKDFSHEKDQRSRPWLPFLSIDAKGHYVFSTENKTLFACIENALHTFFVNHCYLYRYKDYLQWYFFNGTPASFFVHIRNAMDSYFSKKETDEKDPFILLLSTKNRYASVDFAKDNVQYNAFKNILKCIQHQGMKTILFYANEDKEKIDSIIDTHHYHHLIQTLKTDISSLSCETLLYLNDIASLNPEHYIDFVHPNPEGYSIIAKRLFPFVMKVIDHT